MKKDKFQYIERRLLAGMILSSDFLIKIKQIYKAEYIQSSSAKLLFGWILDYFEKYNKAPGQNIEAIFYKKAKKLPKETVQDLEEVMDTLSDEYEETEINFDALFDDVSEYFTSRNLLIYTETLNGLIEQGDVEKAREYQEQYRPISLADDNTVDFSSPTIQDDVKKALEDVKNPLFTLPKQFGEFINHQLIPGGFLAFLAPEKRGKSFMLMGIAVEAVKQGIPVAFFQAGDMSTPQQIRRFAIRLSKKPDKETYAGDYYRAVRDCVYNQRDTCTKKVRECTFGPFPSHSFDKIKNEIRKSELIEAYNEYPDYRPCWNCKEYQSGNFGTVWVEKVPPTTVLGAEEAVKYWDKFFIHNKNHNLKLSTHPSGTLTINKIISILSKWEREENFKPKLILVDYVDIMGVDKSMEFRHQENEKWKGLRRVSQLDWEPLVITVTQSDADSYTRYLMNLKNFSEDKRKYAHVTAFYGMNQDPEGRDKELGIMRINELLIREGESSTHKQVFLLQDLRKGLPFRQSFF